MCLDILTSLEQGRVVSNLTFTFGVYSNQSTAIGKNSLKVFFTMNEQVSRRRTHEDLDSTNIWNRVDLS